MKKAMVMLGMALLLLLAVPVQASAQDYPPTTPTTAPSPDVEVRGFGTIRPGQGFTKRDCGFAAGATVAVSVNGEAAGTTTAGPDGCIELDVEAVDTNTFTVDGRTFETRCGGQAIVVSTGARTVRNTFTLSCDASRGLTTTGASIARWSTIAVGLIAVGSLFVLADRRRGRPRSQEG